jgi:N6-adenosine-specific RNA methylase IME4
VASLSADDCALFLWVPGPHLEQGFALIRSWGFTFKGVAFAWAKTNPRANLQALSVRDFCLGLGYWSRSNIELCLLGTRGCPHRKSAGVRQLIIAPRREHSRKPDEIHQRIEQLVAGPYLELFARRHVTGWTVWGDQVTLFDGKAKARTRRPIHQIAGDVS